MIVATHEKETDVFADRVVSIRDGKVVRMPPSTIDPKKPSILKVMRGGSHMSSYAHVRSAYRHAHQAWQRIPYKGFRVALKTFSASHEREWDRD